MIRELHFPQPETVFTPVFNRLLEADTRFLVNYGGTGSSKSFSAAQKEVLIAIQKPVNTLVIRKVAATLKDSVIPSFKRRITEFDLWDIFTENKSDRVITCTQTGSQFLFRGLDDPEKMKSIEGINRILVEEASELTIEDFLELNRRVRGVPDIQITLNFNPIHEEHWLKTELIDKGQPSMQLIHSTYKDNPFLTEEDRTQIEWLKEFNLNQYRVYALGEWGITENNNPWLYHFDQTKHVKPDIRFLPDYPVYLSFDFNNDPFACIATQFSPAKGGRGSFIHHIQEFVGAHKVEEMCQRIKTTFPSSILYVTGDSSGNNKDLGRNQTLYQMIADYLNLSPKQLNLLTHNLTHADSRIFINALYKDYPNVYISKKGCPTLIMDCQKAMVEEKNGKPSQLRKDREGFKMDAFDAMRYFYQCYFHEYAKDVYFKVMSKR